MRIERSVTSISWIPSEAMTGPMRVPMDLGIGHYDQAPPDRVTRDDLETLRKDDRYRFANHLSGWIDVEDGEIVDAGYSGGGYVGSTTARLGLAITVPGVSFPVLQERPRIEGGKAHFTQTAGGRTGAPLPHRIDRPPYVRMTAPTAWTTLALTVTGEGEADFELVGASPFPRHWVYDSDGNLAAKSGLIDFSEWTRVNDHGHSPWHDFDRPALMSEVESQVERSLSSAVMSGRPDLHAIEEGVDLITQGQTGGEIFLVLDGMLRVSVDGTDVAELGPGAIVGERAVLEGGRATATVTALTPVRAAAIPADQLDRSALEEVAAGHRRERP
ncbi:MAG: cyclic nucleotide-binding domain-containing protein [Acidimicrobiia bacterium]